MAEDTVKKEEEMLPEEKLLNVIQQPEDAPEEPKEQAVEAVASEPEKTEEAPKAEVAQKPKLKLKKTEEASSDEAAPEEEEPAAFSIGAGPAPVAIGKKAGGNRFDIKIMNRALVAIVIIMICFSGWETVGNINTGMGIGGSGYVSVIDDELMITDTSSSGGTAEIPIDNILKMFEERFIFGSPAAKEGPAQVVTTTRVRQASWQPSLKKLKMMGRSQNEDGDSIAIVVDNETSRMYFWMVGDKVVINEVELEVKDIRGDGVTISDGKSNGSIN